MLRNKASLLLIVALILAGCGGERSGRDPTTPSGFVVPRYLVLRFGEVNARTGPSEDHPIAWTYHAKGMPVQIIAETKDWRRICDPEGGISWVAARMLEGGAETVMRTKSDPLAVHSGASLTSSVVASLPPHAIATLDRCKNGWCKIKLDGKAGWTPASEVWGADPAPQCAGLPAPAPVPAPPEPGGR